jgi:hypothetical protein
MWVSAWIVFLFFLYAGRFSMHECFSLVVSRVVNQIARSHLLKFQ